MTTQSFRPQTVSRRRFQPPTFLILTLLVGVILGRLFTFFWPQLPTLATIALWPMGAAVAMILVAIASFQLRQEPLWSLAIGGQLLGVAATVLMFLGLIL